MNFKQCYKMILKPRHKTAKQLGREYPYSYTAIRQLQDDCKLTDEQLKEVVRLANEGMIPLTAISNVLLGFKNFL
jgi:hypothetical protein